jgi:hypothetical protein
MRREISEKTLELNVTAEYLHWIRGLRGCDRVFWFGMTQLQESRTGIDEMLKNLPKGVHLALQFKSPAPTPKNTNPYRFPLNSFQQDNLLRMAYRRPRTVLYVLPHLNTLAAVATNSPLLALQTRRVPAERIGKLPPGPHHFFSDPPRLTIYSEVFRLDSEPLLETDAEVFSERQGLIPTGELREWLSQSPALTLNDSGQPSRSVESNRERGQRLRGFSTIFFPD